SRAAETSADFNQPASSGTYDFLSAIYRIRALPLSEDASYNLSVRGENETYQIEVKVKGRQITRANAGSFETIVTQVRIKSNSGASDYSTKAYFTNDQRH